MQPVQPRRYRLRIEPDLERMTFEGTVNILLDAAPEITTIELNLLDLAIWQCRVRSGDGWMPCKFAVDPGSEQLHIALPTGVSGTIELEIGYQGKINDQMAGFYRSSYPSGDATVPLAVTQFQESDARRAFPCMDHPLYKAEFDITLVIEPDLVAIANTAVENEGILADGRRQVTFETTPKMSTYLLFFGVGPFKWFTDDQDRRVRIVILPGMEQQSAFGLEFGRKALAYSEDYYGIDYPLSKMDLIAVPDFAFGAMENWGAITFRENLLLYDPQLTSLLGKTRICEVIAHEIAHQWFGNLVTPADWKYLWLNESFATFFGYGIVDHYYPKWQVWHQFIHGQTETAFARDALHENFSIEIPGGEHVLINTSTAPIIYNKGGSILRQIRTYLGEEAFQSGLRRYLNTHAYGCAHSHHLWEALEAASAQPVTAMMKSWIEQPGHPLVTVTRKGQTLRLGQHRFTYLPADWDQTWLIPLTVRVFDRNGGQRMLMHQFESAATEIDIGADAAAYMLNDTHSGFYRVRYDDADNHQALLRMVAEQQLPTEDRWGLQNDLFALALGGQVPIEDYLTLCGSYGNESEYLPLSSLAANLYQAYLLLGAPADHPILKTARAIVAGALTRFGFEPNPDEPQPVSLMRDMLLGHAFVYGIEDVKAFLANRFEHLIGGGQIHADISRSVMQAGAAGGDGDTLQWFTKRMQTATVEHDRQNVLLALGAFGRWQTLEQALHYTLEQVPDRNRFIPIAAAAANPAAAPHLWQWYLNHQERLEWMHPLLYERVIASIVPTGGLVDPTGVAKKMRTYAAAHPNTVDVVRLALEKLKINARFRDAARLDLN